MTVIVDPFGTPTVVYSDCSITIQNISAAGTAAAAAALVSLPSAFNVLAVTTSMAARGITLPHDADTNIGDVVEAHCLTPGYALNIYDSGGTLLFGNISDGHSITIRKIAPNTWSIVSDGVA